MTKKLIFLKDFITLSNMCGIHFIHGAEASTSNSLHNRGPDDVRIIQTPEYTATFHRLAIVGVEDGMQPFDTEASLFMCNGEIYNHQEIAERHELKMTTHTDVECIIRLYEQFEPEEFVSQLSGEFAFCIFDKGKKVIHFCRDKLGRKPLFYCMGDTFMEVGSLLKSMRRSEDCTQVVPGVLYTYDVKSHILSEQPYHQFIFTMDKHITHTMLYDSFVQAVRVRVTQTERAIGFLLSGGFDSSLVLSVALEYHMLKQPPHVFTIGFAEDASDVLASAKFVEWLREKHGPECINYHKVILPLEQGHRAIVPVIEALETYDTTTIRASVPMYLISQYIAKNTDVKVLISGEGSDELFGGYLYFKYAPNDQAMRSEIVKLLTNLYKYDVLRADRSTSEHGLEVRTPFLHDEFVEMVLSSKLMRHSKTTTKVLIRDVVKNLSILPDFILHGRKEAFSDAVGFSWKDSIEEYCSNMLKNVRRELFPAQSPYIDATTDETRYYHQVFYSKFKNWNVLTELWLPNQAWVKTGAEPSARALPCH